jgi:hypothetical protein
MYSFVVISVDGYLVILRKGNGYLIPWTAYLVEQERDARIRMVSWVMPISWRRMRKKLFFAIKAT